MTIFTSIWIEESYSRQYKLFYCFNCRTPFFQYLGDVIQLVPGETPFNPAVVVKCNGKDCDVKLKIHGIVKVI